MQKVLLVMILLGCVAYGSTQDYKKQIDLLHQEVNYFIPQTFGMKPPKVDNNTSLINRINHTSGPSGVIEKFGLKGENLTLLKPTKDDIIIEVTRLTGARNKSQAVNEVLEAYVREKRMQKLLDLKGKLHLDDNWKALREMELDES